MHDAESVNSSPPGLYRPLPSLNSYVGNNLGLFCDGWTFAIEWEHEKMRERKSHNSNVYAKNIGPTKFARLKTR